MINLLFILIVISYSYPLIYIAKNFKKNSISDIICVDKCRQLIFKHFLNMCIFLIIYEILRFNIASFIIMILFCLTLLKLILTDVNTKEHLYYAGLLFSTLFIFMIIHIKKSLFLCYTVLLYVIITIIIIRNIYYDKSILISESLLMITFGIYFTILHILDYI